MRKASIYWRIAFSAVCLGACAQLVMMWAEDYRQSKLIAAFPYAYPVFITAGLAAFPWAKGAFRFSLKGLMIAMTLFAVVFAVAYALRR
jgi:hypothetical protein